jgi:hypothetical protein
LGVPFACEYDGNSKPLYILLLRVVRLAYKELILQSYLQYECHQIGLY